MEKANDDKKKEMGVILPLDKASDIIKVLPSPPPYLGKSAKNHFKRIGRILIAANNLKRIHLPALEVMAVNLEQWEWAIREIRSKNNDMPGLGYIQRFSTGAKNISVEVTLKRDAEKAIMQCFKQFGLDPKSEKELVSNIDPNQGSLFDGFNQKKSGLR